MSHSPRLLVVHKSPHVTRKSWILDSTPWNRILITGIQIFFSGTWILDINCEWDSGFLRLYSEFQGPGFRIPQAKISRIPKSGPPYMRRAWRLFLPCLLVMASAQFSRGLYRFCCHSNVFSALNVTGPCRLRMDSLLKMHIWINTAMSTGSKPFSSKSY